MSFELNQCDQCELSVTTGEYCQEIFSQLMEREKRIRVNSLKVASLSKPIVNAMFEAVDQKREESLDIARRNLKSIGCELSRNQIAENTTALFSEIVISEIE